MKIVPIEIKFKLLYENRHLLIDDVEYNSLLVSNIFNTKIKLLDIVSFIHLDDTSKMELFNNYNTFRQYYKIVSHDRLYIIYGPEPENYGYWGWEEYNVSNTSTIIDVLVIL